MSGHRDSKSARGILAVSLRGGRQMDGMVGFALELEVVPPAYYEEDIPIK